MILIGDVDNKKLEEMESKIWDYAYELESNHDFKIHLSPFVKNIDKFNYWLKAMPFYMNIQKEGVVLNES